MYVSSMILGIAGMVAYHLLQRSIRSDAEPLASLGITYITAMAATAVLAVFFPTRHGLSAAYRSLGWPSFALGLAIVAIELGFLLVYRSGWTINVAAGYANVATILLLIPIGVLAFGEPISSRKLLGIACAMVAVVLLSE